MLEPETARQVKWRHATNPRPVQNLVNMQTRLDAYKSELRSFTLHAVGMALVTACVASAVIYLVPREPSNWMLIGLISLGILVPPLVMLKPERPTEQDIQNDIALRRQVGMD